MPQYSDADVEAILARYRGGASAKEIASTLSEAENKATPSELARQSREQSLANESVPAGAEPAVDPILDMIATYRDAPGGGDAQAAAAFTTLFEAAANGDPRVTHSGVDRDVNQRWVEDSHRRNLARRDHIRGSRA